MLWPIWLFDRFECQVRIQGGIKLKDTMVLRWKFVGNQGIIYRTKEIYLFTYLFN